MAPPKKTKATCLRTTETAKEGHQMNMNRIINMFLRVFMRKMMSRGIDAGINMASRRSGSKEEMTP